MCEVQKVNEAAKKPRVVYKYVVSEKEQSGDADGFQPVKQRQRLQKPKSAVKKTYLKVATTN
jgi:hypothetical protein